MRRNDGPVYLIFIGCAAYLVWAALLMADAHAMGSNLIGEVFDQIQSRITSAWDWLWDPLWRYYVYLGLFFLFLLVVGYFLPFKWVRATMGIMLALAVAFVAGARQISKTYKSRLEEEKAKRKAAEQKSRDRNQGGDGGGQSGGGGFFDFFK